MRHSSALSVLLAFLRQVSVTFDLCEVIIKSVEKHVKRSNHSKLFNVHSIMLYRFTTLLPMPHLSLCTPSSPPRLLASSPPRLLSQDSQHCSTSPRGNRTSRNRHRLSRKRQLHGPVSPISLSPFSPLSSHPQAGKLTVPSTRLGNDT
jgi:hypothetical protein